MPAYLGIPQPLTADVIYALKGPFVIQMTAEISGIAKKIGREQGYTASEKSEDRVFICWKTGGNLIKRRPLSEGGDLVVPNLYLCEWRRSRGVSLHEAEPKKLGKNGASLT